MKAGDYIRTKDGIIDKLIFDYNGHCASRNCEHKHISCVNDYYDEDKIIKSSPNIIDLIEIGDYVNGREVRDIYDLGLGKCYCFKNEYGRHYDKTYKIKSIVTKEQFENCMYKVGE